MDKILKNKYFKFTMYIGLTFIYLAITVFIYFSLVGKNIKVNIDVGYDGDTYFVVAFTNKSQPIFNDGMSSTSIPLQGRDFTTIPFVLNTEDIDKIKIYFGHKQRRIRMKELEIRTSFKTITLSPEEIKNAFDGESKDVSSMSIKDGYLEIVCSGPSSYILSDNIGKIINNAKYDWRIIAFLCAASMIFSIVTYLLQRYFNNKKILCRNVVFITLFMLMICSSNLALILGIKGGQSTENRGSPVEVDKKSRGIEKIVRKIESKYNDTFGFRNKLISANAKLESAIFNDSSTEKVILGKEGWLFYKRDDEKDLSEIYRGISLFSEEELKIIKNNLEEKRDWLHKQNIPFVLMIAPNKESVYGEYYSDKYKRVQNETRMDQLIDYLKKNSNIDMVYPKQTLLDKKNEDRLYLKTDTHWNELGAYYGYEELMENLAKYDSSLKPYPISDFEIVKEYKNHGGDLANMLGIPKAYGEEHTILKPRNERKSKPAGNEGYDLTRWDIMRQSDKSKPKLLMFRDSFTISMAPFISEHFSEAVYEWSYNFNGILVNQIKPDFVVQEVVEYKLESLLIENQTFVRQMEVEE